MNRNLRPGGQPLIRKLVGFAIVSVMIGTMLACGLAETIMNNSPLSAGSDPPQIMIQNVNASRDPVTRLPVVSLDYTVTYPHDLYAQTLASVPILTCTMRGGLTTEHTFSGAPINITGTTRAPQTGKASIQVPEDGKLISGPFFISCDLRTDRLLGTSNTVTVEIPKAGDPAVDKAYDVSGDWTLTWNWSVTTVFFVGKVTGGPDQWSFQGILEGGGNAVWTPAKGSATATCTVTGRPGSEPSGSTGTMSCTATFPEGQPWQGNSSGQIFDYFTSSSVWKFRYNGSGDGTGGDGQPAHIDHLDLVPKEN